MKTQYFVYKVSVQMPFNKENIKPGCTTGNNDIIPENIQTFDTKENAILALNERTSSVYARIECRKAYYEVNEWKMDEITIDDNGNIIDRKHCGFAKMDLSDIQDDDIMFKAP